MNIDGILAMKDSNGLKEAIGRAAATGLTSEDLLAQRVSFVFASVSEKSGVTKEKIRQTLLDQAAGGVLSKA